MMKTSKGSSFPTSTSMPAISHLNHLNNHVLLSHPNHHHHHHVHVNAPAPASSPAGVLHVAPGCQLPVSLTPAVDSVMQQQQQQMQLEVLRKRQYRVGLNVFNKGPPEVTTHTVFQPLKFSFHSIVPVLHASPNLSLSLSHTHTVKKSHVVCVYAC